MSTTLIKAYEVIYSANQFSPRIGLKGDGRYISQLVFAPNGTDLPPDSPESLYYHLDDLANVLDLLRNEAPVYLFYSGSDSGYENGLRTSSEPVGERANPGTGHRHAIHPQ
jgi:hypothetical protein